MNGDILNSAKKEGSMNRTFVLIVVVIVALFYPASALIKSGTATLRMNEAISFTSGKAFIPNEAWSGPFVQTGAPCSLSVDSIDLFFLSHDCGTCLYYCPCELLGSARAFYISQKSIDQLGMENNLNLGDTTVFNKIESKKNCFEATDSNGCFLPSVASGQWVRFCPSYQWGRQPLPLIVSTSQKKHVVIGLIPYYEESCSSLPEPMRECRSYVASINLQWFMQTDGTANFKGIFTAVKFSNSSPYDEGNNHIVLSRIAQSNSGLFDILGRKMSYPLLKSMKIIGSVNHGIFVDENSRMVLLLFR
jgi:hypothetical protein